MNTHIATVREKNNCARHVCSTLTGGGVSSFTVKPPSIPTTLTQTSATHPNFRIQERFSDTRIPTNNPMVSNPTVVPASR